MIGPNGAGKTTLFNVIGGSCDRPAAASPSRETDLTGWRPDRIATLGIARNFQQVRLVRASPSLENVMVGCHARINRGVPGNLAEFFGVGHAEANARRKAREMLDFVGFP